MANEVGGEVDSYCTKCKMMLAHTIVAMVGERVARVHCNTCNGEHVYKAGPPGSAKPKRAAGAKKPGTRSRAQVMSYDDKLAGKDAASAKPYSIAQQYAPGDLMDHPTFGLGIVDVARSDKVDVTFRSFVKTLIHGRVGPARARPSYRRAVYVSTIPEIEEEAEVTPPTPPV